MASLPLASDPAHADRLAGVMDAEGKIARALDALAPLADRDVAVVDVPGTDWVARLGAFGPRLRLVPSGGPLRLDAPVASIDAFFALWTGFRGVDPADLAEVDRVLRPDGRLVVVHDYGRDDISALHDGASPEYASWSRREGPFLRDAGFRIRVLHCFWTFPTIDAARETLAAFGERGEALGARLRRPRLSWNVALYHRRRHGVDPGDTAGAG